MNFAFEMKREYENTKTELVRHFTTSRSSFVVYMAFSSLNFLSVSLTCVT